MRPSLRSPTPLHQLQSIQHIAAVVAHAQHRCVSCAGHALQRGHQPLYPTGAAGQQLPSWRDVQRAALMCYVPAEALLSRHASSPPRQGMHAPAPDRGDGQRQQKQSATESKGFGSARYGPSSPVFLTSSHSSLGPLDFDADEGEADGGCWDLPPELSAEALHADVRPDFSPSTATSWGDEEFEDLRLEVGPLLQHTKHGQGYKPSAGPFSNSDLASEHALSPRRVRQALQLLYIPPDEVPEAAGGGRAPVTAAGIAKGRKHTPSQLPATSGAPATQDQVDGRGGASSRSAIVPASNGWLEGGDVGEGDVLMEKGPMELPMAGGDVDELCEVMSAVRAGGCLTMDDSVDTVSDSTSTAQLNALAAAAHTPRTAGVAATFEANDSDATTELLSSFGSLSEDDVADASYGDTRAAGCGDPQLAPWRETTLALLQQAGDEDAQVVAHQLAVDMEGCGDEVEGCSVADWEVGSPPTGTRAQ